MTIPETPTKSGLANITSYVLDPKVDGKIRALIHLVIGVAAVIIGILDSAPRVGLFGAVVAVLGAGVLAPVGNADK